MPELRQLRYFVMVAEEGQITRAASRLHVAQPALSQAIAQLEARLGVALFVRHARGMTLTAAGEAYLEAARTALTAVADADRAAQSSSRADRDRVEWGFLGWPPMVQAPELFNAFTAANIVRQIEPLLPDGPLRQSMMKELASIKGQLTPRSDGFAEENETAISRVAAITIRQMAKGTQVSESV